MENFLDEPDAEEDREDDEPVDEKPTLVDEEREAGERYSD